jgi:ribosome biogenesis GTPase
LNLLLAWGLRPRFTHALESLALSDCVIARVVSAPGGRWRVVTERGECLAEPSGRLTFDADTAADLPAVGDWIAVRPRPGEDRATVVKVLPRETALVRKAAGNAMAPQVLAANVDVVFLVSALPDGVNLRRLERYLAAAWDGGTRPVLILNKADLCDDPDVFIPQAAAIAP